jgi:hypothetical protein
MHLRLDPVTNVALCVLTGIALQASASRAEHPVSIALIAGTSIPINGLNYNEGLGVRAGANVAVRQFEHVYVGGVVTAHAGDSLSITWGPDAIQKGGVQYYTSHPGFVAADIGYSFAFSLGRIETVLTPCLSAGLMLIEMDTNGTYGSTSIVNAYGIIGFAASYDLLLGKHFFVGAHYRMYDTGDTTFQFGNLSNNTYEHGFSTSVFYYALFSELGYRF